MDGSVLRDGKKKMLRGIHDLLDEADAVVTWNGDGFDLPILNKEFLLVGLKPPAPYKSVDLLQTSRKRFRFTSNKLAFVAKQLGCTPKQDNRGHELWLDCMNRKPSAFREMLEYNRGDVVTLAEIYERFIPWIKGHPNHALYSEVVDDQCPHCGSTKLQARGYARTARLIYQRVQCNGCGAWSRKTKPDAGHKRGNLLVAA